MTAEVITPIGAKWIGGPAVVASAPERPHCDRQASAAALRRIRFPNGGSPWARKSPCRRLSAEPETLGCGGEGVELVGSDYPGAAWPAFSPDGGSLYFQVRTAPPGLWSGRSDIVHGYKQIRRLDLETGRVDEVTTGQVVQQGQTSSGGAIAPDPSPDGRWVAFARRIPDGTMSHKGLRFGPRTALWLRDRENPSPVLHGRSSIAWGACLRAPL